MEQFEVFQHILKAVRKAQKIKAKPIRLAINGIEGTGKTTFAYNLVNYLCRKDLIAIHISIDGFHFNKERRYKQGRDSADGYYEDAYDEAAFVKNVLQRSQGDPPEYIEATHDLLTDIYLDLQPIKLADNSVLVTDGCYLFKPVFNDYWDLKIYLKTDFQTALERGVKRDQKALGGYEQAKEKFQLRYHAASKRYISEINPEKLADIVIDNTDFENLNIISTI